MLVVTRKLNEAVVIGDGIEVQVLRYNRDGVRLGITAPPHVTIHRREIYDLIRTANASAASGAPAVKDVVVRLRDRTRTASAKGDGRSDESEV